MTINRKQLQIVVVEKFVSNTTEEYEILLGASVLQIIETVLKCHYPPKYELQVWVNVIIHINVLAFNIFWTNPPLEPMREMLVLLKESDFWKKSERKDRCCKVVELKFQRIEEKSERGSIWQNCSMTYTFKILSDQKSQKVNQYLFHHVNLLI